MGEETGHHKFASSVKWQAIYVHVGRPAMTSVKNMGRWGLLVAVDQLYWFRFRFGSGLGSVLVLFPEPKGNKEYEATMRKVAQPCGWGTEFVIWWCQLDLFLVALSLTLWLHCANSQLVCLLPFEIFKHFCLFEILVSLSFILWSVYRLAISAINCNFDLI